MDPFDVYRFVQPHLPAWAPLDIPVPPYVGLALLSLIVLCAAVLTYHDVLMRVPSSEPNITFGDQVSAIWHEIEDRHYLTLEIYIRNSHFTDRFAVAANSARAHGQIFDLRFNAVAADVEDFGWVQNEDAPRRARLSRTRNLKPNGAQHRVRILVRGRPAGNWVVFRVENFRDKRILNEKDELKEETLFLRVAVSSNEGSAATWFLVANYQGMTYVERLPFDPRQPVSWWALEQGIVQRCPPTVVFHNDRGLPRTIVQPTPLTISRAPTEIDPTRTIARLVSAIAAFLRTPSAQNRGNS